MVKYWEKFVQIAKKRQGLTKNSPVIDISGIYKTVGNAAQQNTTMKNNAYMLYSEYKQFAGVNSKN